MDLLAAHYRKAYLCSVEVPRMVFVGIKISVSSLLVSVNPSWILSCIKTIVIIITTEMYSHSRFMFNNIFESLIGLVSYNSYKIGHNYIIHIMNMKDVFS